MFAVHRFTIPMHPRITCIQWRRINRRYMCTQRPNTIREAVLALLEWAATP